MQYVNPISFGDYTTKQDITFSVTLKGIATSQTALVSVKRFTYNGGANGTANGVDISGKASIAGQVVTLTDFWANGETKAAGMYRVQIIANNTGGAAAADEANVFVNILY